MKRLLFSIVLSSIVFKAIAQSEQQNLKHHQLEQFGLVWGFMKYYHPEVSAGKLDWNQTFINFYDEISEPQSQETFQATILKLINSVNNSKIKPQSRVTDSDLITKNVDFNWFSLFENNVEIVTYLEDLNQNKDIDDFYVSFQPISKIPTLKNETGYEKFDAKLESHRMLTLFSFYNLIHYQFVNKHLLTGNYRDNLKTFIPMFLNATTTFNYDLAKTELVASIEDSHAFYLTLELSTTLFKYKPVFGIGFINEHLVVQSIYNEELAALDNIELGDVILEIDGIKTDEYFKNKLGKLISHSNQNALKRVARFMLFDTKETRSLNIQRNGAFIETEINLYEKFETMGFKKMKSNLPAFNFTQVEEGIGYISLEQLTKKELRTAFKDFKETKGIIIDLRNYPKNIGNNDLAKYLFPERKQFMKVLFPSAEKPSYALYGSGGLKVIADPFKAGGANKKYYKGKVILLVNHTTISKAEFIGATIQASPNCTTIGEQTAGAVLNIAIYTFPDSSTVNFTSLGAYYPDGTSIQKQGLKIDKKIKNLSLDFSEDLYLKEAIKIIKEIP